MIKHIVCWKLYDEASGRSKKENAEIIRQRLLDLKTKIPVIRKIEAGINAPAASSDNYDVVLITEFDSIDDLYFYRDHPDHQAFVRFIQPLRSHKVAVDFEF